MFSVKQVSKIMNISPYTLRFYDKEGLFPDLTKSSNGRRYFSLNDLQWVYIIQCFRESGMPLAEIREYVKSAKEGDSTVQARYKFIERQKARVTETLETVKRQLEVLDMKTEYYKALMRGESGENWLPDIQSMIDKAGI